MTVHLDGMASASTADTNTTESTDTVSVPHPVNVTGKDTRHRNHGNRVKVIIKTNDMV